MNTEQIKFAVHVLEQGNFFDPIHEVMSNKRREENQVDATEYFIALIICSTCFGHLYAHHQELETILVLLPRMVYNTLAAGGRLLGAEQQAMRPGFSLISDA